jgi:hypothetical protein
MLTQGFRFLALTLTALIFAAAFAHVLEMPAKLAMSPVDYLVVQQIYTSFGPVGSVLEPAAIVSAAVLALLLRRRPSFVPALVGALALVVGLLVWVAVVNPVNAQWAAVVPGTVPEGFEGLRLRWEWGHAVHAALLFLGFVAVVVAVLLDVPVRAVAAAADRVVEERAA